MFTGRTNVLAIVAQYKKALSGVRRVFGIYFPAKAAPPWRHGMTRKTRTEIPAETAAQVLFASDRTCCVCRKPEKPVQIHHLDENPANNDADNLAVLCFDCHHETHIRGGFCRK